MPIREDHSSLSTISDQELPIIITTFNDFEFEERVIRLLSQMGFPIGERKILGQRAIGPGEILVTDQDVNSKEIPIISLATEAKFLSDPMLHHHLSQHFIPHSGSSPSGLVITGGEGLIDVRGELLAFLAPFAPRLASFQEGDCRLALIPTRRRDELDRLARFSDSSIALFLLSAERKESHLATSFIEYRRRIHPHLQVAFVIHGGRKQIKAELGALLEPFTIFWLEDERDDLLRIRWGKRAQGNERFHEISEWIGSHYGDAHQPRTLIGSVRDNTRRERDRAPFRVGGAVANSR